MRRSFFVLRVRLAMLAVIAMAALAIDAAHAADAPPAAAGGGPTKAASVPAAPAAVPSAQDLANPEWIAHGRKRFISACAYCHGQQGEAGKVKSFKERLGWDPQRIHDAIAKGSARAGNVMPAWADAIPDADIWKIVAYVKSLSPAAPGEAGAVTKP